MINSLYKLLFIIPVLALVGFFGMYTTQDTHAFSTVELEGYAWSSNIGWISMNCSNNSECATSNYKVQINPNKTLSGYAWSSNIGWIKFGGLSGFPAAGGNATVVGDYLNGWSLSGWARALAYGDGWDGWISISGIASDASSYAVDFSRVGNMSNTSYAWGSDVIGWVNFSASSFTTPCVAKNSCNADYSGTFYTDMWCDTPVAAETTCVGDEVCTDANPVCAVVIISGDLTITPSLVRKDGTVTMDWTIDDPLSIDSCRVTSSDGGDWSSNGAESSSLTFNTNIFTLYCIPFGGGPEIEVDSEEVRLLPNQYES